jgi:hypothetical protein
VIQVIQVARHGARQSFIKPNKSKSSNNAHLTNRGFAQMSRFGNKTAKKYAKELELHSYNPSNVKIVSSTPDRCIFSAKAFMYGFFWKKGQPKHMEYLRKVNRGKQTGWEIDTEVKLDLRDFKIKKISAKRNFFFNSHSSSMCPEMKKIRSNKNPIGNKKLRFYIKRIFKELKIEKFDKSKYIQTNKSQISQILSLFEVLYTKYFSYPKSTPKPISYNLFRMITIVKMYIHFQKRKFKKTIARISASPLLGSIRKDLFSGLRMYRKKKKSRRKLVFYSGQAPLMISFMEVFGLTNGNCFKWAIEKSKEYPKNKKKCKMYPKFAENFTFVVKEEESKFFVELYFGEEMIKRKTFTDFTKYIRSIQVKNFNKSCYGPDGKPEKKEETVETEGDDIVLTDKNKREKFRNKKLNHRKFKDFYIIQKLEQVFGERPVELLMFALFCGALFISFKHIYANFAIKQKLKSV